MRSPLQIADFRLQIGALVLAVLVPAALPLRAGDDPEIRVEVVVAAPVEAVWNAWTTAEGLESFFAREARVDLRPGGAYEILFDPAAAPGDRGADDMEVMLVQPHRALAFTWNAPPRFPDQRPQRTHVMIRFRPLEENRTRVVLVHDGFGEGEEWDAVRAYFENAWGEVVLPKLVKRFE